MAFASDFTSTSNTMAGPPGNTRPPFPPHARPQRIEVERLERSSHFHILEIVGDEQPAIDKMDIGLDAAKATLQRLGKRSRVLVVVVRMRRQQWNRVGREQHRPDQRVEQKKGTHAKL